MAPAVGNSFPQKKYKGEPMYLDFVNADVTHILRMINEISEENIIWDPEIAGRQVSMILKNVPWDQALELILANAGLAKRYVGKDIIWITTKAKLNQIIAEEEAAALKAQQKIEDELKRKREMEEKAKEAEPLVTEYIPVDFAGAEEIQPHITLSERGSMSIDSRTNTMIIKDVPSSIEAARTIVKQFDIPVKQIMIEARIVDATTDFSRDLGLRWGSDSQYWRRNMNVPVTVPPNANDFTIQNEKVWGGSFSTSAPDGWAGNIGLAFAQDFFGLGALTLDATLALAETEGKAKIMSAPKVIAREGTAATISSGDVIIIPATENVPSTTLNATLSLTVTPEAVSYNNYITLVISVTDDQAPSTQRLLTKNINTTLLIKSGDTFVIGGIIKESEAENESGIPGLRRIPILGKLFNAKRKTFQRSELLIFVTPTVLPPPA
jgi:type IV pilus assembly protein PilQ